MSMCTFEGDAKATAQTASRLYDAAKGGDSEAVLNFRDVMLGINYNSECDTNPSDNVSGHDQFVRDVYAEMGGALKSVARLGIGTRPGYPRMEEEETVDEIHVPVLNLGTQSKRK